MVEWGIERKLGESSRGRMLADELTAPTADELKSWLSEGLRQSDDWRSGISINVVKLAPSEVPELAVRYVGDGSAPPKTETIGFTVRLTAHRMSRGDAVERLRDAYARIASTLDNAMILPAAAEYEGVGELAKVNEDADRNVFSASFAVYLGVEVQ